MSAEPISADYLRPHGGRTSLTDEERTKVAKVWRRVFLSALHHNGYRDLRAKVAADDWLLFGPAADDPEGVDVIADGTTDRDLFFGVAERLHENGRGRKDCGNLRALFVDVDFKSIPEDQARATLAAFPFPPSAVVHSGAGLHCYWLLREPIDLQKDEPHARAILLALAATVGGDKGAATTERILRVPGTFNHKYAPPRPVVLEYVDASRRYDLAEIVAAVGPLPEIKPDATESPFKHDLAVEERIRRARGWLETQEPAIQGQGGDQRTYTVCCAVAVGHDLDEDSALAAMKEWNARCGPPWPASDLRAKIRNGIKYATEQRGAKLKRPPCELVILKASEVPDERIEKVFGGRFVRGSFTVIAGPGEAGKGMFAVDALARFTTGEQFPGDSSGRDPVNVMVCTTEDSMGRVKARLEAAGADLDHVYFAVGPSVVRGGLVMPSPMMLDDDAGALVRQARQLKARVLFLETTVEHLGDREGKVRFSTHNETEVRRALAPTRAVCREAGLFGLGAMHPRKSMDGSIDDSISGSAAFRNVGRSVLNVFRDPLDKSANPGRLLCASKANYGAFRPPTFRFRIESWEKVLAIT